MKKIISIILITLLCSTFVQASFAAEGTEGYIYSTDILAYVNGKPIDSYQWIWTSMIMNKRGRL